MDNLILGNVDYGMVRCSFNRSSTSCPSLMNTQNYNISECEQSFFPIEWSIVDDNLLSVCGTIPWWLPLFIASTLLAIFQLLGILVVIKYLNKIVDPIAMLAVSQNCCCLAPVFITVSDSYGAEQVFFRFRCRESESGLENSFLHILQLIILMFTPQELD